MNNTSQTQDPIEEIKNAEQDAQAKKESAANHYQEKLENYKIELEKKVKIFEEEGKVKGTKKLTTVKGEATQLLKTIMASEESKRKKIVTEATEKEKEAITLIVKAFENIL
jgi:hypothetical protein